MDDTEWLKQILNHVHDGVYMVDTSRRIQFWNHAAERITGFSSAEVAGHCCADNILTHVDGVGCLLCKAQCPLARTIGDGETRKDTVYLHHKEGHRIPVEVAVSPMKDTSGRIIGAVETFRECSDVIAMRSSIELLKGWGCVDISSGLANRRIVEDRLEERLQEFERFGWPCGILLIEVDLLPEVQKEFGAPACQEALQMAARCSQNALRSFDTIGRWDEKTFLAVIANATAVELGGIAERVRMLVDSAYRVLESGQLHVTVSIGAASVDAEGHDNSQSLLQKARASLYESKAHGRNRVTVFGRG